MTSNKKRRGLGRTEVEIRIFYFIFFLKEGHAIIRSSSAGLSVSDSVVFDFTAPVLGLFDPPRGWNPLLPARGPGIPAVTSPPSINLAFYDSGARDTQES